VSDIEKLPYYRELPVKDGAPPGSSWGLGTLNLLTDDRTRRAAAMIQRGDADLSEAIRLLSARTDGWSDVAPVALPLESLADALADLAAGTTGRIKTLIDPWAADTRRSLA
jgi:hypothetical protein